MKIANSQVSMASLSEYRESKTVQESLRQWRDSPQAGDHITLSSLGLSKAHESFNASALIMEVPSTDMDIGLLSASPGTIPTQAVDEEDLLSDRDADKIKMLEKMIEMLTGKKFKFNHVAIKKLKEALQKDAGQMPNITHGAVSTPNEQAAQAPQRVGWGIDYNYKATHYQYESTTFSSVGKVQTQDGRQIDFELNFHMSREIYSEFSMQFKAGDALIDPLVIQLDDGPLQLSDDKIKFDIDVDGLAEDISLPLQNAGILFYDRNANGIADDGSELFGPSTGDGFDELRMLDDDQNGWLDENDSLFSQLRLWIRSPEGDNKVLGLIEAGVGAIFLESSATAFDLKTSTQENSGKLRETGVYLRENGLGGVGRIHEIDFKI